MRFISSVIFVLLAMLIGANTAWAQLADEPPVAPETLWQFSLPLQDGELQLGDLLADLGERVGMDSDAIRKQCDYLVPIRTPIGSSTVQLIRTITGDVLKVDLKADQLVVTVDRIRLREERGNFNKAVQRLIETFFPEAASLAKAQFGTVVHLPDGSTASISAENAPKQAVVLIHGLDDVGQLWRWLTPRLVEAGYGVCEVTYPDDQAISDSTAYIATLFEEMRRDGVQRVSIVAHSMGSLISRDLITNPAYFGGSVGASDRFPAIDRLIMLGPPNHGSKMALLRLGGEARDQVVRVLSGDGLMIGGFFDGAGEAQDDLQPDSDFLMKLNARALPADLPVTIIAGSASPILEAPLQAMADHLDKIGTTKYGKIVDGAEFKKGFEDLIAGVGDGCVSLDSARLDGVSDFVIVEANHLSMIKNYSMDSDRVPPAVPIILDRLARDRTPQP